MKKTKTNIIIILLTLGILNSSFGFTIYLHHCNIKKQTTISINKIPICQYEVTGMKCSCQANTPKYNLSVNTNTNINLKIAQSCCSNKEKNNNISIANILDSTSKNIINSSLYQNLEYYITQSYVYDKLENYYETFDKIIITPINRFIKFIQSISSLNNSDNEEHKNS
jgi:hypothetical protein